MTRFTALTQLLASLPAQAEPLRAALREHIAAPSREAWRLVCALACSVLCDASMSAAFGDGSDAAINDALEALCAEQGWPELIDLLSPSDAENDAMAQEMGLR